MHVRQPRANGARRNFEALFLERQQRAQRRAGVIRLMTAAEGDGQRFEPLAAESHVERDPRALFPDVFRRQGKDGQLLPFAAASSTPRAAFSCRPSTTGTPGFIIPAFSSAICSIVSPRSCM